MRSTNIARFVALTVCALSISVPGTVYAQAAEKPAQSNASRAFDEKLSELVAKIDSTTGASKIDAISAVVKELVKERALLREDAPAMRMENCPMMKGPSPKTAESGHDSHHPEAGK